MNNNSMTSKTGQKHKSDAQRKQNKAFKTRTQPTQLCHATLVNRMPIKKKLYTYERS